MSELLTPTIIRNLLELNDLFPHKQLGQNFMVDPSSVRKIVRTAQIKKDDLILEIGPGLGSLTLGLLEVGAKVKAVEIDKKLAALLPKTISERTSDFADNLQVINRNALELSSKDLDFCNFIKSGHEHKKCTSTSIKLVANLPYNLAAPILLTLLERFDNINQALVLVQAEVADRLVSEPSIKTYGIPSAKLAFYGDSKIMGTIPRSAFYPVPRVDSKLVGFERLINKFPKHLRENTFTIINLAFSARRKTLRSLLVAEGYNSDYITNMLDSFQIDPLARGETLNIFQFVEIAKSLA